MDKKVTHKYIYGTLDKGGISRSNNTACHIENKTWSYKASFRWDRVTCKKCKEYK